LSITTEVAPSVTHESVVDWPERIVEGFAVKKTILGGGWGWTPVDTTSALFSLTTEL
jgi:hypothetical protein